ALRVARLAIADRIVLSNGQGVLISAEIVATSNTPSLSYRVLSVESIVKPKPELVLVQSLAKAGRDELAIQTATELGVSNIIPWQADRAIVRWNGDKQHKARERWQKIVTEAAKQSMNAWIPEVAPLMDSQHLAKAIGGGVAIVLEPTAQEGMVARL